MAPAATTLSTPLQPSQLPTGTVTFLFTDVESSTQLLNAHPEAYRIAIRRHHDLILEAVHLAGGAVFETVGDAVYAAFARPTDAVNAALDAQRVIHREEWGATPIAVRVGIHLGEVELQHTEGRDHYFGAPLYRCARLMATAHGGQIVVSEPVATLVRDALPENASLRDLGAHRLKDLARPEHVFQLCHPALPVDFPALRSLDALPNNLPLQLTPLVGREREVAAVRQRLLDPTTRLLTLVGPGGTGKTRLGLQAAAEMLDDYANGAYFVNLEPIRDPALVLSSVAQTIDVRESGERPLLDSVRDYLREKHLLLVLDNFEHLVAAGPLVADLLRAAPRLTVLATSRAPLRVSGEREFAVPPLDAPDPLHLPALEQLRRYEAVRLFVQRAQDVRADFALTSENAAAVAEICHRLDGLPLAIELAAARAKLFPAQALLARLGQGLAVLSGGARDLPARQQTLRNAISWSYDLLTPAEQATFRRLAVFTGGCTVEAAEAIAGDNGGGQDAVGIHHVVDASQPLVLDVLEAIASLVDNSLLREEDQPEGQARFLMLETIREFGLEQLEASGEGDAVHRRHAAFYAQLAEESVPALRGPDQVRWLDRLERELANSRAALNWAVEHDAAALGLRLAAALATPVYGYWAIRGDGGESQAQTWLGRLLASPSAAGLPALRARALTAQAIARTEYRRYDRGAAAQAVTLCRELGDHRALADALLGFGGTGQHDPDDAEAYAALGEALELYRAMGDRWSVAATLMCLATATRTREDFAAAHRLYTESLAMCRELGDRRGTAAVLGGMANMALVLGDWVTARASLLDVVSIWRELGHWNALAQALGSSMVAAWRLGNVEEGRTHAEEYFALVQDRGWRHWLAFAAHGTLGYAALREGDFATARAAFVAAINESRRWSGRNVARVWALAGFVALAVDQGHTERALRLAGAVERLSQPAHAMSGNLARVFMAIDALPAQIRRARQALAPDVAAAAWAAGQAMSLDEAVAYALADDVSKPLAPEPRPPAPAASGDEVAGVGSGVLTGSGRLSEREREVAVLVARGYTNPQIAAALTVTRATAARHVEHILAKLDLQSRVQVATWAMTHGLLPPN